MKRGASELVAIRGKWQKERTRLYDRDTGLPTVAAVMDELTSQLRETGALSVLSFCPGSEGRVEEVWGWQAYDDLMLDFVRRLKAFQADGILPSGMFCLPHVSSDEVLLLGVLPCSLLNAYKMGASFQRPSPVQVWRGLLARRLRT